MAGDREKTRSMPDLRNKRKGNYGETAAAGFLRAKGYEIHAQNYKRGGEIDIVAKHRGYVVFVEVKYRKAFANWLPVDAVTPAKQRQIIRAAQVYIAENGMHDADIRFDVIEVVGVEELEINHIEDAFNVN